MKKILVADHPAGVITLHKVMNDEVSFLSTNSLHEAMKMLRVEVNLVICGIHFDDCRMFDLLRMAKANPVTREIPFLCFRDLESALAAPTLESLNIASTALGAKGFVDLYDLKLRFGVAEANRQFRRIVRDLLV